MKSEKFFTFHSLPFTFYLSRVVRCFLSNGYIMWVAFGNTTGSDTHKATCFLKCRNILSATIAHTCTQTSYKLVHALRYLQERAF